MLMNEPDGSKGERRERVIIAERSRGMGTG